MAPTVFGVLSCETSNIKQTRDAYAHYVNHVTVELTNWSRPPKRTAYALLVHLVQRTNCLQKSVRATVHLDNTSTQTVDRAVQPFILYVFNRRRNV